ncbi:MAG: hypothetical protein LBF24_03160 [Puniceicoccales bacterium]|jgi:hypothetical protein|nr:hypothetical protein [Puniceicoccales bacterium]
MRDAHVIWRRQLLSSVGILCAIGILPLCAVDDGLHYANVFDGYDVLRAGFRPIPKTSAWLQGGGSRGSLAMADSDSAKEEGQSLIIGGILAVPQLPLAGAVEIFASRRWGHAWRQEEDAPVQDRLAVGGGGEFFLRVLGNDLRLVAAGERVSDKGRGSDGAESRSNVFHLGGCLSHRLLPVGPLALGLELTVFHSRIATKAVEDGTVSVDGAQWPLRKDFDSVRNWRAAPGVFLAFLGLGHANCRVGGRWIWDLGKRPTFPRLVPRTDDDVDFAAQWNASRAAKTGPKSGYGETELAIATGLSHGLYAELNAAACCRGRRAGRLSLTVGKDF